MRRKIVSIALAWSFFVAIPGISQTSNAQLSGVVTDQSGALIPGVSITLTKTDTGIVTTAITNEAGVYNLQGLQPGSGYRLSAALPGFQTFTYTDVSLAVGSTKQRNFQLQVATAATRVEVSVQGAARATRYATSGNFQPYGNARLNPTQYWKIPKGKVEFNGGVLNAANNPGGVTNNLSDLGTYFGEDRPGNVNSYTTLLDPQCYDPSQVAQVDSKGYAFALSAGGCQLRALAQRVPAGTPGSFFLDSVNQTDPAVYVLVNPKPGEYGVLTPKSLTRFGFWSFDANIQKSIRISESKQLTIRVDATNVLNHPEPFIPLFSTNDVAISQFGVIECGCGDSKSGNRAFQAQVRLAF